MGNGDDDLYKAFDFGMGIGIGLQLSPSFQIIAEGKLGLHKISNIVIIDDENAVTGAEKNYGLTISLICFFNK